MTYESRRKLEAAIQRLIFKNTVRDDERTCGVGCQYQPYIEGPSLQSLGAVPQYLDSLEAAWSIVERLRCQFWIAIYDERHQSSWRVSLAGIGSKAPCYDAVEETVPEAICHCALLAIGKGELWPTS